MKTLLYILMLTVTLNLHAQTQTNAPVEWGNFHIIKIVASYGYLRCQVTGTNGVNEMLIQGMPPAVKKLCDDIQATETEIANLEASIANPGTIETTFRRPGRGGLAQHSYNTDITGQQQDKEALSAANARLAKLKAQLANITIAAVNMKKSYAKLPIWKVFAQSVGK